MSDLGSFASLYYYSGGLPPNRAERSKENGIVFLLGKRSSSLFFKERTFDVFHSAKQNDLTPRNTADISRAFLSIKISEFPILIIIYRVHSSTLNKSTAVRY